MIKPNGIHVFSEIKKLKRVLLHRPGREIDNLTPSNMERLLFDDLPDAYLAGLEHDDFSTVLQENGVEVIYVEDLMAEIIADPDIRRRFLWQFLNEGGIHHANIEPLSEWLADFSDAKQLIDLLIAGIRNNDTEMPIRLPAPAAKNQLMILEPMPNLYFSRDPFSFIGKGVSHSRMYTNVRQRETLLGEYIFKYHPDFQGLTRYFERTASYPLEGGDILVLSEDVVAVGISERTNIDAISLLADRIINQEAGFKYILAIKIPFKRAFMHLDTVLTMIDYDMFTVHPEIEGEMEFFEFSRQEGKVAIKSKEGELSQVLAEYLGQDQVKLIRCGGGDPIDAQREQWSDGSNTLAVAPGKVIVYSRNHVTNRLLEEAGVELLKVPSSELSRGRGGPRCMSMPIWRE